MRVIGGVWVLYFQYVTQLSIFEDRHKTRAKQSKNNLP